ncbi:MAG: response regulator transcription factor [Anaerolineaceae bacterium]|nr:response regulator transcription factor [Anaerolineaceae bacterium]
MTETIRVLVADDHMIVRQGLRLILETGDGFELVGEAVNGQEAVVLAKELKPDVILMDLRMPVMDGLSAIEEIQRLALPCAVVILTNFNEDDMMVQGLTAGAKGFLLKDTEPEALFNAIRAAARGETLLQPDVLYRLLARTNSEPARHAATSAAATNLTEREMEVLRAVARGLRSKEIAYQLGISERTIKAHLAAIYFKLGVDSRSAAIGEASRRGWLDEA